MNTQKPQTAALDGFGTTNCARCGRTLKDPKSVVMGIGPVCRGKIRASQREGNDGGVDPWDPETMNVTLRRHKGLGITNIVQIHKHHSPTGMEWGYAGSGAADLALNILARFLPMSRAGKMANKANQHKCWDGSIVSGRVYELHQEFKFAFITPMAYHGGTIEGSTIRQWLLDNGCPASEITGGSQVGML